MRKNQIHNGSSTSSNSNSSSSTINNTSSYSNCLSMLLMNNSRKRQVDYVTRSRGTFSSHSSKESLERQIKSKLGATPKKNGSSSPQIQPLRNYSNSLFTTTNSIASSGIRTRVATGSNTSQTSGTFAHAYSLFNSHPLPENARKVSSSISDNSSQIIQLTTSQWNSPAIVAKTITGDTQNKEQITQIPKEQFQEQPYEETKQIEKKDIADLVRQVNQLEMKLDALRDQNIGESQQKNNLTVKPDAQKILLNSTEHIPGQCHCKDHTANENVKHVQHDQNHARKSGNFHKAMISLETIPILQTTYQTSSLSSASSPFHSNSKNPSKATSKQCVWINEQQAHQQQQQQQQQSQQMHILTEEYYQQTAQLPEEQKLVYNQNTDQLRSLQGKIAELEAVIGCKNLEVLKLKEQLYQTKDSFIHKTSNRHLSLISEHKRRSSFSSSSELVPLSNQIHTKFVQSSIMEWGYAIRCQGGLHTLLNSGWRVQQNESKGDLSELRQVVGVIGMAHTGKTTLINGIMKGSLQTVEDANRISVFENKVNIIQDDSLAIFEYTLNQPIYRKNIKEYRTQTSILGRSMEEVLHQGCRESVGNVQSSSAGSSAKSDQVQQEMHPFNWSCSSIDELWLEFFIQKTPTLVLVIDKFTAEEQKMIGEIFTRLQSSNQLALKELIIVHNYFGKGLRSAEELQAYFSESLQFIDGNFKAKSIVDLKMYRTLLVQEQTISKKCLNVSHILNGNLFDPFAEKYQHNTLAYCMERFSQAINSPAHFMSSFEEFLNQRIGVDGVVNDENVGKLDYNSATSNLYFKKKQNPA